MKKTSLKKLAEENGFSLSTIFRVLRNYPGVATETREAVIHTLNIHGYNVENRTGAEKVVVDVPQNNLYTERIGELIAKRLRLEKYDVVKTFSYKKEALFQQEIADADAVVFAGLAPRERYRTAKDINPAIYRVGLFNDHSVETELSIAADNLGGTTIAADYLAKHFGNIAIFCKPEQKDSAERAMIAYGYICGHYPQVRCDLIRYKTPLLELTKFYEERGREYDAFFYQNGDPWVTLEPLLKAEKRKTFQLIFNNPEYILEIRDIHDPVTLNAYIDFEPPQFGEFVAFYLRNRPLLQRQPPLITLLPTKLVFNNHKRR